jgi:hypothetical protein
VIIQEVSGIKEINLHCFEFLGFQVMQTIEMENDSQEEKFQQDSN